MTFGATHLVENFLATLHLFIVQVSRTWNGKSAMPYQKRIETVIRHLGREVVHIVIELICFWREKSSHSIGNALVCAVGMIGRIRIGFNGTDNRRIFSHCFCPGIGGVEIRTIAARNIRYVPNGICPRSVLK